MAGLLVLLSTAPVFAAAYYVAQNGTDRPECGDFFTPCRSIQLAANKTRPGDVVFVSNGLYRGFIVPTSGTASAHVTYAAYPGTRPFIQLTTSDWWGIAVPSGVGYIDITGFTIYGSAPSLSQAQAATWASQQFLAPANGQSCIAMGGDAGMPAVHHVTVYQNEVALCPGAGIYAAHGDYINVLANRVHENGWWNWNGPSGISLYELANSDPGTGYKNFILNNIVYRNIERVGHVTLGITDGNGIVIDKSLNTDGTRIPYRGRTYIANNVVYQNGGNGIIAYLSQHVDIVNNSTYANDVSRLGRGEIQANLCNDIRILNNILYGAAGRPVVVDGRSSALFWDYNLVFGGDAVAFAGPHDLFGDPLYVSAIAGLFQLASRNSPAVASGTSFLAPTNDVDGVPRQGHIDRGAYQTF